MCKPLFVLYLFLVCFCSCLTAQNIIQSRQYPQKYFRYPLDLPPVTAGSFGELRPNHFHSGLDFKTNQTTGYPVHAVFDGYVSRLRVQFGGFGNAIYITHPNGYTTVYGHIEKYSDAMLKIIRDSQYKKQSFEVDIKLPVNQITVCKDEVIALSGNAGASEGPHLHFEIRDTKTEETINPQLFGLTIPDKVPPTIYAIGIYHLDGNPFSEKTPRQFLAVTGSNGNYHLARPGIISLNGSIGFGLTSNDLTSVSPNHNGIYSVELKLDGNTVYTFAAERFAFDQTHAINAYIDYPEFLKTKRWMQKCFILPGNIITLFPQAVNRGIINFNDDALHQVQYVVKDVAGNTSTLTLEVKSVPLPVNQPVFKAPVNLFHYNEVNQFANGKIMLKILPGNLYDDVDFTWAASARKPGALSATYSIINRYTPIHDSYELWIKPDTIMNGYMNKAVIVSTTGACEGGIYQDGYIKANPHIFGDFFVKLDTIPPQITPLNIRNGMNLSRMKKLSLKIGDNLSGIKSYAGTIDGEWVLMEWDFKTKVLSYIFTTGIQSGKHIFNLTVTDMKNNTATFKADFYR